DFPKLPSAKLLLSAAVTSHIMTETEELYLLRFRYGRAAEMLLAYKTFLYRQVSVGEKNYCQTDEHVRQVTHTLLLVFYSFIYSMFDKSGTDFVSTTEPYVNFLTDSGKKIRNELIDVWEKYKTPISKLRHNIGFHGGVKVRSHEVGYGALTDIHPQTAEFIMNHLAIFFMELDIIIPPSENYNLHIDPTEAKKFLLSRAEKLKADMDDTTITKMMDDMKKLFGQ
ncbi:MAG: hypothetical protein ACPLX7_10355, partial [Candidatus Kapaibacteriota bacterium]